MQSNTIGGVDNIDIVYRTKLVRRRILKALSLLISWNGIHQTWPPLRSWTLVQPLYFPLSLTCTFLLNHWFYVWPRPARPHRGLTCRPGAWGTLSPLAGGTTLHSFCSTECQAEAWRDEAYPHTPSWPLVPQCLAPATSHATSTGPEYTRNGFWGKKPFKPAC